MFFKKTLAKLPMTNFSFADPSKLSLEQINNDYWPHDGKDRPLIFHPLDVCEKLPFNANFASKYALITALTELCRSIHYLWTEYNEDIDDSVLLLKKYINQIYVNYGENDTVFAIDIASCFAPSCSQMLDLAADGIGSWAA
jgi:hypothetical protein